jgi:CBS domain-containing protein
MEQIMTEAAAPQPSERSAPATVADVMHPPVTTVEQGDHVAAAAYLMKHAGATALMVVDPQTGQPNGIITEADIARVVADGKNVNDVRIHDLMTSEPTVIDATTSIRKAARIMTNGHFRHLPVVDDTGLIGMVDISEVCAALLGPDD